MVQKRHQSCRQPSSCSWGKSWMCGACLHLELLFCADTGQFSDPVKRLVPSAIYFGVM
ncbi:hypothetical protein MA16_Dca014830 [Dendrobium catenatum]|uniref:Uncharacterized protein n=1 Tax=Dendrobium catenatum TaxID=906689 RepID=A0A2I0XB68_9ASPA|nr:hypothetical protein MA16_Dca014830 [Dendrobium catenatum]